MLRGNRQKLSVYGAGRIIICAELLQPFSYTLTPCGIFTVAIYESATPVMPRRSTTTRRTIHFRPL
jgi:hypothetical protein